MTEAFDKAFLLIIGEEGNYQCNPDDPGNWTGARPGKGILRGTKYGISASAFPTLDIKNLTLEEAKGLYQAHYWYTIQADSLPYEIAIAMFDCSVNSGPETAISLLQKTVSCKEDGILGPETMAKTRAMIANSGMAETILQLLTTRACYLASLTIFPQFGKGWMRRLIKLSTILATQSA